MVSRNVAGNIIENIMKPMDRLAAIYIFMVVVVTLSVIGEIVHSFVFIILRHQAKAEMKRREAAAQSLAIANARKQERRSSQESSSSKSRTKKKKKKSKSKPKPKPIPANELRIELATQQTADKSETFLRIKDQENSLVDLPAKPLPVPNVIRQRDAIQKKELATLNSVNSSSSRQNKSSSSTKESMLGSGAVVAPEHTQSAESDRAQKTQEGDPSSQATQSADEVVIKTALAPTDRKAAVRSRSKSKSKSKNKSKTKSKPKHKKIKSSGKNKKSTGSPVLATAKTTSMETLKAPTPSKQDAKRSKLSTEDEKVRATTITPEKKQSSTQVSGSPK